MLREFWDAATTNRAPSLEQRAQLRLAITGAIEQGGRVVDFAFRAAGADAIFQGSAFERRFRDMHTLTAQGQAHLSNFEGAGAGLVRHRAGAKIIVSLRGAERRSNPERLALSAGLLRFARNDGSRE